MYRKFLLGAVIMAVVLAAGCMQEQTVTENATFLRFSEEAFEAHSILWGSNIILVNRNTSAHQKNLSIFYYPRNLDLNNTSDYFWELEENGKYVKIRRKKVFNNVSSTLSNDYFDVETKTDRFSVNTSSVHTPVEATLEVPLLIGGKNTRFDVLDYETKTVGYNKTSCHIPILRSQSQQRENGENSSTSVKKMTTMKPVPLPGPNVPAPPPCNESLEKKVFSNVTVFNLNKTRNLSKIPLIVEYSNGKAKFLKINKIRVRESSNIPKNQILGMLNTIPDSYRGKIESLFFNVEYPSKVDLVNRNIDFEGLTATYVLDKVLRKNGFSLVPFARLDGSGEVKKTCFYSSSGRWKQKIINSTRKPLLKKLNGEPTTTHSSFSGQRSLIESGPYITGNCGGRCGYRWIVQDSYFTDQCTEEKKDINYKVTYINVGSLKGRSAYIGYFANVLVPGKISIEDIDKKIVHGKKDYFSTMFIKYRKTPTDRPKVTFISVEQPNDKVILNCTNCEQKTKVLEAKDYVYISAFTRGKAKEDYGDAVKFLYISRPPDRPPVGELWRMTQRCKGGERNLIPAFAKVATNRSTGEKYLEAKIFCNHKSEELMTVDIQINYETVGGGKSYKIVQKLPVDFELLDTPSQEK